MFQLSYKHSRSLSFVLSGGEHLEHWESLKALVIQDNGHKHNFRFSIIMLLPMSATPDQVIAKERLFKQKLGTNAHGLNNN